MIVRVRVVNPLFGKTVVTAILVTCVVVRNQRCSSLSVSHKQMTLPLYESLSGFSWYWSWSLLVLVLVSPGLTDHLRTGEVPDPSGVTSQNSESSSSVRRVVSEPDPDLVLIQTGF